MYDYLLLYRVKPKRLGNHNYCLPQYWWSAWYIYKTGISSMNGIFGGGGVGDGLLMRAPLTILLRSTFCFYWLRGRFHVGGFRICNLPQLFFDMEFHVIIVFQKSLFYHIPFGQNRDINLIRIFLTLLILDE